MIIEEKEGKCKTGRSPGGSRDADEAVCFRRMVVKITKGNGSRISAVSKKTVQKRVQCKILGDIDSTVQKWNLDHNENASCRMYITHEGDPICIVQKNGYKTQVQILVNH